MLRIRLIEKDYALTGDAKQAEALRQATQALQEHGQALGADLGGASQQTLGQVEQAVTTYRAAFDRYVELTDNMRLSLEAANWLVVSASNSLDVLQSGLNEDGVDLLKSSQGAEGAEMVAQGGEISRVYQSLLLALNQARVRLEQSRSSGDIDESAIQEALDAQKLAGELRESMKDPGYAAVLTEVIGNIDSFNDRLKEYTGHLRQQGGVPGAGRRRRGDSRRRRPGLWAAEGGDARPAARELPADPLGQRPGAAHRPGGHGADRAADRAAVAAGDRGGAADFRRRSQRRDRG